MASKRKNWDTARGKRSQGWGAARGVGTSLVPIAGQVSAYRGAKHYSETHGVKGGAMRRHAGAIGVGAAAVSILPGAGSAVGAAASGYRGYSKAGAWNAAHSNQRNAKTGARSTRPTPTATKGRVRRKG